MVAVETLGSSARQRETVGIVLALPLAHQRLLGPLCELLARRGWLGTGRLPNFERTWHAILPALSHRGEAYLKLLEPLSNGIYQLVLAHADTHLWARRMVPLIEAATTPAEVLRGGQILAWLAGMAPYRSSALELLAEFPEARAPLLWGLATLPPDWRTQLAQDPWYHPLRPLTAGLHGPWRMGGLQATGGPFASAPVLAGADWLLQDSQGYWQLFADIWGARLVRARPPALPAPGLSPFTLAQGQVRWQQYQAHWPELAAATGAQSQGDALLVTVPSGWLMLVVGRTSGKKVERFALDRL